MRTIIGVVIILFFIKNNVLSQDTLTLLNGKPVIGNITSTNDIGISITCKGLLFKSQKVFYKDEIYSMKKGQKETILYSENQVEGNLFNSEQMKYFINGLKDGRKNYHAPLATIGGLATGLAGGVFGFWGITIPSTYVLITGLKTPHLKLDDIPIEEPVYADGSNTQGYGLKFHSQIETKQNEDKNSTCYTYGWETAAKDKKIKNALRGSIIGFFALVATSYLLVK